MGRKILLGVSGGIAAYKACEICRRLGEQGHQVQVVMTAGAQEFVTPLTFQALTGREVRTTLFDTGAEAAMGHIELARWADLVLVAPASADVLARAAQGMANDLLTTVLLATQAPVVMAPAMNQQMWQHAAVQANIKTLEQRGVRLLGPGSGAQACGEVGPGRMLEPADILAQLAALELAGKPRTLEGVRVLLTAGPTREALDPVRYITNRSSGRMGFALAEALRDLGAQVHLVHGPVQLPLPSGLATTAVETAQDMHAAVLAQLEGTQIFVGTAAVADYRPSQQHTAKMKKHADALRIDMVKNPDILQEVAQSDQAPFAVGFAAETHDLEAYARDKMQRKKLHMICANEVGPGKGFDVSDNTLQVYWPGGQRTLGPQAKSQLAIELAALIAERYRAGVTTT
nr:bifunctional phosphopantothenoylcysteine decarboxylase/phosphopantothenate--cysteine ligase CoaBC [Oceanococcus sp. HetDA_MAG_MS8]